MVLSTRTLLCNHHHYPPKKTFSSSHTKALYTLISSHPTISQAPANHCSIFCVHFYLIFTFCLEAIFGFEVCVQRKGRCMRSIIQLRLFTFFFLSDFYHLSPCCQGYTHFLLFYLQIRSCIQPPGHFLWEFSKLWFPPPL